VTAHQTKIDVLRTQLRFIYNSYRTALLNRKYYGEKLARYQTYNSYMEIAIAIGATGSGGVAGFAIWGTITGKWAWIGISSVATVLSILKPILQTGKAIEKYTKLYVGHTNIFLDLKGIVEEIEVSKTMSKKIEDKYNSIRHFIKELGGLDDPKPDLVLIRKLQVLVNAEIAPESLWVP